MAHLTRLAAALTLLSELAVVRAAPPGWLEFYRMLLQTGVKASGVDYTLLARNRQNVARAVAAFDAPDTRAEPSWPEAQRFAFWINAYNAFTIAAIVDHYPIRGSWFSLAPQNSIRQIDGVWTRLKWKAAGREVTLDDIEHRILRPTFHDPRVHFAINCASRSCPPVRPEPYDAAHLDAQLDGGTRQYLASPFGLQVDGTRLKVSSIFKWYGEDFVPKFAGSIAQPLPPRDRAILGVIAAYGPPAAAAIATSGHGRIAFLSYDWSLNDLPR